MSTKDLLVQAAGIDASTIAKLLDEKHREAHNAKLSYESTKSHLLTAGYTAERVQQELAAINERIQKEIRTHQNSLHQLEQMKQRWLLTPDEAREQIAKARAIAVDAAKMFAAVKVVADMNRVASSVDLASTEFDELLGETQ